MEIFTLEILVKQVKNNSHLNFEFFSAMDSKWEVMAGVRVTHSSSSER